MYTANLDGSDRRTIMTGQGSLTGIAFVPAADTTGGGANNIVIPAARQREGEIAHQSTHSDRSARIGSTRVAQRAGT